MCMYLYRCDRENSHKPQRSGALLSCSKGQIDGVQVSKKCVVCSHSTLTVTDGNDVKHYVEKTKRT